MKRFVYVFAGLVVTCGTLVSLSAGPLASARVGADVRQDRVPGAAEVDIVDIVDILVNGVTQPRYAHAGRWYVEALKGREYAIQLRNPYPVRVAVALSVDGLNTIDARETTARSARKWIIEPHGTLTISGWQTSQSQARRFEFTTEARSYGNALGKTANLGVISAVFFKERPSAISELSDVDQRRLDATPRRSLEPAMPSAAAPAPSDATQTPTAENKARRQVDEYAATGMGRRTDHMVREVSLDLEEAPADTVDIRYEFRPQLVRLGILRRDTAVDRLPIREGARGFAPEFSPEPDRR